MYIENLNLLLGEQNTYSSILPPMVMTIQTTNDNDGQPTINKSSNISETGSYLDKK
jgi:hypothetical protein